MSEIENTLTCTFHPKRETQLRCNRCEKPICIKCATRTPTGYRCPECIRSQQKIFITTKWFDQILAGLITAFISYLGSRISLYLGFYTIFIALGAGYLAILLVKKAINNRRSPMLKYVISGSALLGSLLPLVFSIIRDVLVYGFIFTGGIILMVWPLAYAVIISVYVYIQLKS